MTPDIATMLKALAEPLRLRIITLLREGELAIGELAQVLGITQPRVSHHIKILRENELVKIRREGAWTFCSLLEGSEKKQGSLLLSALEPWTGKLSLSLADRATLGKVVEARRLKTKAFFDEIAKKNEGLDPLLNGTGLRHQALSLLVEPGLILADLGCGTGFMTEVLSKRAARVILIDQSEAVLNRAKSRLGNSLPSPLEFRIGEADGLPLSDCEVHGLFANLVLHHAPDLNKAFPEMLRVLKPGGFLVISDLLPHKEEWMRKGFADLRLGLDPEELSKFAESAGFDRILIEEATDTFKCNGPSRKEVELPLFLFRAGKPVD